MKRLLLLAMLVVGSLRTDDASESVFDISKLLAPLRQERATDHINTQVVDSFKKDSRLRNVENYAKNFKYGTYSNEETRHLLSVDPIHSHEEKQNFKFPNEKTFVEFEEVFRSKYNKLSIPRIDLGMLNPLGLGLCIKEMSSSIPDIHDENLKTEEYEKINNFTESLKTAYPFVIASTLFLKALNLTEPELEWGLLHEAGHGQKPYIVEGILNITKALPIITPFIWGFHKKAPYKNIITKIGSKALATLAIPTAFFCTALRLEERRADNFANKHANKEALLGGLEFFNKAEKLQKVFMPNYLKKLPYSMTQYILDPIHPSIGSRVAKIKTALKTRFNVEV